MIKFTHNFVFKVLIIICKNGDLIVFYDLGIGLLIAKYFIKFLLI